MEYDFLSRVQKHNIVYAPRGLIESDYIGPVFGIHNESSETYNIVSAQPVEGRALRLGNIEMEGSADSSASFYGVRDAQGGLAFYSGERELTIKGYDLTMDIFSRNAGILETPKMLGKTALIVGCGSVGSLVALELARAGVGRFILVDNDILEYHNICRHQCGVFDVGKYKVDAVKERILQIHPGADVTAHVGIVETMPMDILDGFGGVDAIAIGCGDNRTSDTFLNKIAMARDAGFISIGFWERAFAGEIFYHLPNAGLPCYGCSIAGDNDLSARAEDNHRVYSNQENLEDVKFAPGISVDINFVTGIGLKLALDILNRSDPGYTLRVLDYLTQFTLICNTNKPEIGGEMAEIFSHPLQVTHSIVPRRTEDAPPCTCCTVYVDD